jgi:hypothetical protein
MKESALPEIDFGGWPSIFERILKRRATFRDGEQLDCVASATKADCARRSSELCASGVRHTDGRLSVLKGTGFSPYVKPAKSRGL